MAQATRQRVLVIDDSATIRAQCELVLEDAGFHVATTDNPIMVHSLMRQENPDIVLVDVNMPAIDGHEVVKILRSRPAGSGREGIVLLYSGIDEARLKLLAEQCGADGYVRKTGDMDDFVARIAAWAARHRLRRATRPG
jgi:DNA-binding response OmpR family regulator